MKKEMTDEFMSELAEDASIELACHNHVFEGNPFNVAEYVYFKAVREGRLVAFHWITQACHITILANWIDLTNDSLYDLSKEDSDGESLLPETEQPVDGLDETTRSCGTELSRNEPDEPNMVREGSGENQVPNRDSGEVCKERTERND